MSVEKNDRNPAASTLAQDRRQVESLRVAQLLEDGVLEIGAIHTYVELYAPFAGRLGAERCVGVRRAG